jgi:putative transposase
MTDKRSLVDHRYSKLSIRRQCQLLGVNRSSLYHEPKSISIETLDIMNRIDKQYTKTPFYGVERMTQQLKRDGVVIGHNRVRRLMRLMGLMAVYPKPKTSKRHPEHKIYAYLLRGVAIERVNQVWSADITYIRLIAGFVYLVAILDWFSRYVLSWSVSNSLDSLFCMDALDDALRIATPEIFNSDQGSQFTSRDFTGRLEEAQVRISMDGRGRVFDNIFSERLWRSVKYEEVYLDEYRDVQEAISGLGAYFDFYNHRRPHQSLDYRTPAEVYFEKRFSCFASRSEATEEHILCNATASTL